MKAALLNELALLARTEADAILQPYAWPPRDPLSAEEKAEHDRLLATARAIGYRADVAAYEERGGSVRLRAARWFRRSRLAIVFVSGPPEPTDLNFIPRAFGKFASGASAVDASDRAVLVRRRP